jgi:hypothetical protein
MEKEFVSYDLALRIKALGYKEPCFGRWWFRADMHKLNEQELEIISSNYFELPEHYILAPTWQQVFKWFREEHNMHGIIYPYSETVSGKYGWMIWFIGQTKDGHVTEHIKSRPLTSMVDRKKVDDDTYWKPEEAELACIEKLLEIVEEKQKKDGGKL